MIVIISKEGNIDRRGLSVPASSTIVGALSNPTIVDEPVRLSAPSAIVLNGDGGRLMVTLKLANVFVFSRFSWLSCSWDLYWVILFL